MELQDKVIVVTGAGRGIGASAVELFAANGAKVVAGDINDEWGREVEKRVQAAGGELHFQHVDVTDEASVEALIDTAVERYGRLDGIVNNAATIVVKKVADLTAEEWDRVMAVNTRGVFFGCKHAVRRFQQQGGGGSIVNIGSISALVGLADQAVYCASKGAVVQLTRQIAVDYSAEGIRCNAVGPGSIDGEFLRTYLDGQADPAAAERSILDAHPIDRLAQPREVGEVLMFLLSDRASFVTGANYQVDGGYTAT